MNGYDFVFTIPLGIAAGLGIALFVVSRILSRNILGKNENTFETYSRVPIEVLNDDECYSFLGMDSGIRWRGLKKQASEMGKEEGQKLINDTVSNLKYRP